jgi:hypothetical protein
VVVVGELVLLLLPSSSYELLSLSSELPPPLSSSAM